MAEGICWFLGTVISMAMLGYGLHKILEEVAKI